MPEYQLIATVISMPFVRLGLQQFGRIMNEISCDFYKRCILIIYVFTLMQQRTVYHHSITLLYIIKILHTVLTL